MYVNLFASVGLNRVPHVSVSLFLDFILHIIKLCACFPFVSGTGFDFKHNIDQPAICLEVFSKNAIFGVH